MNPGAIQVILIALGGIVCVLAMSWAEAASRGDRHTGPRPRQ